MRTQKCGFLQVMFLFFLLLAMTHGLCDGPEPSRPLSLTSQEKEHIAIMFELAQTKDSEQLEDYGKKLRLPDPDNPVLSVVYSWYLYAASPDKYGDLFIEIYPIGDKSAFLLYEVSSTHQDGGILQSACAALEKLAEQGNEKAMKKLFLLQEDAAPGEEQVDMQMKAMTRQPILAVRALAEARKIQGEDAFSVMNGGTLFAVSDGDPLFTKEDWSLARKQMQAYMPKATPAEKDLIRRLLQCNVIYDEDAQ